MNKKTVRLSLDDINDPGRFRERVRAATGHSIPSFSQEQWKLMAQDLLASAVDAEDVLLDGFRKLSSRDQRSVVALVEGMLESGGDSDE